MPAELPEWCETLSVASSGNSMLAQQLSASSHILQATGVQRRAFTAVGTRMRTNGAL